MRWMRRGRSRDRVWLGGERVTSVNCHGFQNKRWGRREERCGGFGKNKDEEKKEERSRP
jgi:hypothetical protein